ncbi:hypothetical protein Micbo1qcDRAFT_162980 [Microdochium bolleyi]|uniref:Uncharacterized protein n=1 Tax=Microdochium bolleyi TaxID=196109 RepID=A0A136J264_9PEZI|nr:hypothetical protein Micbo1qcDRAFT_162980 [Microdochium bolleyi]
MGTASSPDVELHQCLSTVWPSTLRATINGQSRAAKATSDSGMSSLSTQVGTPACPHAQQTAQHKRAPLGARSVLVQLNWPSPSQSTNPDRSDRIRGDSTRRQQVCALSGKMDIGLPQLERLGQDSQRGEQSRQCQNREKQLEVHLAKRQ